MKTYHAIERSFFGWGLFGWLSSILVAMRHIDTTDPNATIFVSSKSPDFGEPSINNRDAWTPWFKPTCGISKDLIYFLEKEEMCKIVRVKHTPTLGSAMGVTGHFGNFTRYDPAIYEKARKTYRKHIHIHDFIQHDIDKFCTEKLEGKKTLAVHIRGTDKTDEYAREPNESIFTQIQQWIETKGYEQVYLCTDEKSTAEYFQDRVPRELGVPLIVSDVFRLDSRYPIYMVNRDNYLRPEHDGPLMKGIFEPGFTNFRKGYEVIFDVFTMARCQGFLRWRSNVSDWVLIVTDSIQESKFLHSNLPTTYKH